MRIALITMVAALLMAGGTAMAGSTATHTVTVTVLPIDEVAIVGSPVTLTMSTTSAEGEPGEAGDATSADLSWTTNAESARRITVETDIESPLFTLTVEATGVSNGTAASAVTPTTSAQDLITAISAGTGNCDLSYVGSVTEAGDVGSERHTITYTILSSQ